MPTAGILRPAEVVFYHPLDNFVESTVGQTWTGSGGFTPGKIGSANSAIAADAVSWGSENDVFASINSTNFGQVVDLGPTKVVVIANVFVINAWSPRARVGTISGTDITWGTEVTVRSGNTHSRVAVLDASTVVFATGGVDNRPGKSRIGTVTGNEITLGPEAQWGPAARPSNPSISKIDATHFLVSWGDSTFSPNHGTSRVGIVSGTDITYGPTVEFSTAGVGRMTNDFLDSTRFLLVYNVTGDEVKARIGTVSGTDVTYGAEFVAVAPGDLKTTMHTTTLLSATSFLLAYRHNAVNFACTLKVGTISGTDITFGPTAEANDRSGVGAGDNQIALAKLTSTSAVVTYLDTTISRGPVRSKIATISGTDITFGSESDVGPALNTTYVAAASLDSSSVVVQRGVNTADGVDIFVGTVDSSAGITAPTPAAYPDATGNDRLVLAMWVNKLGAGISTITAQRDFTIAFTATTIALGPATATWSDGDIGTLMSTMAVGEHFLVLDFEHTGAGSWTLKTSLDGLAFTSQGAQDSGTRATSPAGLTPGLSIVDPSDGQWVDELVMWAGDKATFESFEAQELANLFDLADTFDEPMNQYEENFGAPICWQATAKMPDGTVWRDSGSGPCPPVVRVPRGAEDVVVTDDGSRASPRIIEG